MAVLQYINNKDRRFQIFIANRLAIIHENSTVSQWWHVTSQMNPADYASRGMDTGDSVKLNQWLSGPMFLQQEETAWPQKKIVGKIDDQDPELKKETHVCSVNTKDKDVLQIISEMYSDWKQFIKVVSWLLRFKKYVIHKFAGKSLSTPLMKGNLKPEEMDQAATLVIKFIQRRCFTEELQRLGSGRNLSSQHGALRKLQPIMIDGVMRVGGRLEHSNLAVAAKQPVILPKRSVITDMIVRHYHHTEWHSGPHDVLSKIRHHYWIVNGLSAVKHIFYKCIECRKQSALLGEQLMAQLPEHRLQDDEPHLHMWGLTILDLSLLSKDEVRWKGKDVSLLVWQVVPFIWKLLILWRQIRSLLRYSGLWAEEDLQRSSGVIMEQTWLGDNESLWNPYGVGISRRSVIFFFGKKWNGYSTRPMLATGV